jgi:hypothetical protein
MVLREIIAIYSEDHKEPLNKTWANVQLLNVDLPLCFEEAYVLGCDCIP